MYYQFNIPNLNFLVETEFIRSLFQRKEKKKFHYAKGTQEGIAWGMGIVRLQNWLVYQCYNTFAKKLAELPLIWMVIWFCLKPGR